MDNGFKRSIELENVIPLALELSKRTEIPSFTVGFEKDCFLALAVVKDGKVLTTNVIGSEIGLWGMKNEKFDLDIFCQALNLSLKKFKIEEILTTKNINIMLEKLEQMLNVPLWLSPQWINKLNSGDQTIFKKA